MYQAIPLGIVAYAATGRESRHLLGIQRKDAHRSVHPAGGHLDVFPRAGIVAASFAHVQAYDLARIQRPSGAHASAQCLPMADFQQRLAPSQFVTDELRSGDGKEGAIQGGVSVLIGWRTEE